MREILFRGKREDNGEWVEGFYTEACAMKTGAIIENSDDDYYVDPATVGQYTGLQDKNGNKIFEGDIISYNGSKEVVYFDTSIRIPCFTTGIGSGSSTALHPYKISKRHIVIGNIHDNPELWEENQ